MCELYPAEIFRDLVYSTNQELTIQVPNNPELIEKLRRKLSLHKVRNGHRYRGKVTSDMKLAFHLRNSQTNEDEAILSISLVRTGVLTENTNAKY